MPTMATFSNAPALGFGQRRGARPLSVQYLVVAGGGGGGRFYSGGGGAGGYRANVPGEFSGNRSSAEAALVLNVGTPYALTVGAGGAAGTSRTVDASNGGNSTFGSIVSLGGGGGQSSGPPSSVEYGERWCASSPRGLTGGSGGGAGRGSYRLGGLGTAGQGGNGGGSEQICISGFGGGGGGAYGNSRIVHNNNARGGPGAAGLTSSITGTAVDRAGGGGGYGQLGGVWRDDLEYGGPSEVIWGANPGFGAGTGADYNSSPINAVANTGSGGGGGGEETSAAGVGGSGVVVIKIPDNYTATFSAGVTRTGGTAVDGFRVWTVTAAGASDTVTFSRV